MTRRAITLVGVFFLGMFAAFLLSSKELINQPLYLWLCLAVAILLFIAAAFVGRPVKKETEK